MNKPAESHSAPSIDLRVAVIMVLAIIIMATFTGCSGASVTPREGSVSGKILNISGKPVESALVTWAYDNTRWCLTDENGAYYIDGIGFGEQVFQVEAFGYRTMQFSVTIYSGQTSTATDQKIEAKSFDYSEIKVAETSATHALITWKTTDYTNGLIEYGETESLGRTVREPSGEYATTHSLKITGLSSQKQYFFKIVSSRQGRDAETSDRGTFTTTNTLEDKTAPAAPNNVQAAINSSPNLATIFWAPVSETDLKGYRVYRAENINSAFTEISNILVAKGQERYTDVSVVPGKKYFYRVTSVDQANNESGYNNITDIVVPGDISTTITWTRVNSPYLITGDINILETGRLNIDAGVEVLMADSDAYRRNDPDRIDFIVSGALVASAGNQLPVVFAAAAVNPSNNAWNGLKFENTENPANTLVNVQISDSIKALSFKNSNGIFSQIKIMNSQLAVEASESDSLTIDGIEVRKCSNAVVLNGNKNLTLSNSTFYHPSICVNSTNNDGLTISGCNFLEFTSAGLLSNEAGGVIMITNNLFAAPNGWAMKFSSQSPTIEYNTFDVPYCIQMNQGNPIIRKNLLMAKKSVFSVGKAGMEHLSGLIPLPIFGPNNIYGFESGKDYIGCEPTSDSTSVEVLLMKDLNGDEYDYRLRQPYPNTEDSWGINRTAVPFKP